ncbi:solute carrier family 2, facilitated glucose transporter member 1-like [Saccostrea cucullata]|uniref:solute carrier family 2, facilitated glucose transporter member 1-like n=1 Tax=Saccostrea cuccullata TaxID=36930 RepID=UPI002ED4FDA8
MTDREVNYSCYLLCSVFFCVFGNSFLYGYNIGDVNNPAKIIQMFYEDVLTQRAGGEPTDKPKNQSVNVVGLGNSSSNLNSSYVTTPKNNTKISPLDYEAPIEVEWLWSVTVAIFVLFGMVGAFISGKWADYFGRQRGMILITFIMFLAALFGGIPKITRSFEVLIVHRALVGLHCGLNVSLASLYLAEISPKKIRGAIGTCHQLFITVGILWSNIMGVSKLFGTHELWEWVFIFNAIPALVCLIGLPFCPESPRYLLIKKNEEEEARDGEPKLFLCLYLFLSPVFCVSLDFSAVVSSYGINAVMSFSSFMYKNAGVEKSVVEWVVCLTSLINVLTTIVAVPLMEKLGRRPLLIYPMCCMVISFIALTIFHNLQYDQDLQESRGVFAIIAIIAMHTYVIGFALGLGPIPFIVVGEIFRQEPRAAAMSLSLTFNWVCNFILNLIFRFMQKAMLGYVYLPFIGILVGAILFIFFKVPETKNRTFDEIAATITRGRHAKEPFEDGEEMQKMNEKS